MRRNGRDAPLPDTQPVRTILLNRGPARIGVVALAPAVAQRVIYRCTGRPKAPSWAYNPPDSGTVDSKELK